MNKHILMQTNGISPLVLLNSMTAVKAAKLLGVEENSFRRWKLGDRNPKLTVKKLTWLSMTKEYQELSDREIPLVSPMELIYKYSLQKEELAELMGVSIHSVEKWAKQKREPSRSAKKLAGLILKIWDNSQKSA